MKCKLMVFLAICMIFIVPSVVGQQEKDARIQTTTQTLDNGRILLKVQNLSNQPVSALVAVGTALGRSGNKGTSVRFFDSVLSPGRDKDLMPNGTYTFNLFGPKSTQVNKEVTLKAALFGDGSSYGDQEWVNKLLVRRKTMLANLGDAIKMLQSVRGTGKTRDQLIKTAEDQRQVKLKAGQSPEEKIESGVFEEIAWAFKSDAMTPAPGSNQMSVDARVDDLLAQFVQRRQRLLTSKPSIENLSAHSLSSSNQ